MNRLIPIVIQFICVYMAVYYSLRTEYDPKFLAISFLLFGLYWNHHDL